MIMKIHITNNGKELIFLGSQNCNEPEPRSHKEEAKIKPLLNKLITDKNNQLIPMAEYI